MSRQSINWTPIVITLILVSFVSLMIAAGFYYYELRPQLKKKKVLSALKQCEKKIYNRPNELNMEWAEGKEWSYVSGTNNNWGWIYPDQGGLRSDAKDYKVGECLKEMGVVKQ